MLAIASEVGYSETALVTAHPDKARAFDLKYFSPKAEIPFGGHATIATIVAINQEFQRTRVAG
jgi:PhzF family phenazine biosynthesis protein